MTMATRNKPPRRYAREAIVIIGKALLLTTVVATGYIYILIAAAILS